MTIQPTQIKAIKREDTDSEYVYTPAQVDVVINTLYDLLHSQHALRPHLPEGTIPYLNWGLDGDRPYIEIGVS